MIHRRALHAAPQSWIVPTYGSLDGLRGVAFLTIFIFHYGQLVFPWQRNYPPLWAGVDLFFVLSGFLITGILFDAKSSPHYFRHFYIRRALRILPLFYGFFLAMLLLRPVFHFKADYYVGSQVLYIANLCIKGFLLHRHGNPTLIWIPSLHLPIGLATLWSLCVEEQFYLFWPLVIWLIPSRRRCLQACLVGVLAVLAVRTLTVLYGSPRDLATGFLYYTTWSRCDGLLLGSALALWLRGVRLSQIQMHWIARWLMLGSVALLGVGFSLVGYRWPTNTVNPIFESYGYTAIAVGCVGVLLLAIDPDSMLSGVLRSPWLVSLGKISYGLYFFHGLPMDLFHHWSDRVLRPHHLQLLLLPIAFAWTWGIAWLSFRYFESPFLRLKSRLAPSHTAESRQGIRLLGKGTAVAA